MNQNDTDNDKAGGGTVRIADALDLHATVESNGISIHMDGDRDGELWIEGPENGGEVHDGEVYRIELRGAQNGVTSDVGFFIPADDLRDLLQSDIDTTTDHD